MNDNNTIKNKRFLIDSWWTGVNSVKGDAATLAALRENKVAEVDHILAVGKAACAMVEGACQFFSEITSALIVTKYEHVTANLKNHPGIEVIESGHPIPDQNSLLAGKKAVKFVEQIQSNKSLLVLVSGGASALLESLPDDMSLDDLKRSTDEMLAAGMDIHQINTQRKQFSQIKGGKLLSQFKGRTLHSYAISDAPGDDINVIGSGIGGLGNHTGSINDCDYIGKIIASNQSARHAIAAYSLDRNISVQNNSTGIDVDVSEAADIILETLNNGDSGLYIWGGEPTVVLPENPGDGGRNQHLALLLAKYLSGSPDTMILVAGSDGTDGDTKNAGGIVDGGTWLNCYQNKKSLENANSENALHSANALFRSGPTGTNVMDIIIALKQSC